MAITSMTRFKSDKTEKMIKNAKQAKKLVENMGPNLVGCPGFTPAYGWANGSSLRATRAGKCMAKRRRD